MKVLPERNVYCVENLIIRRVSWRILPLLILCYFVNYLDRTNIGVAALTMRGDLNLSDLVYSWGAAIFFLGYLIFEVPSNVILHRVGARLWISRIMITWGIVSSAMAFTTGSTSFYILRFLLGISEAGFFPGIILYLSHWFPEKYHGRIIGLFMIAIPLSSAIGNPISIQVLAFDSVLRLHGWQWLFLLEGTPAVLLGIVVLFALIDRPEQASWLSTDERGWLAGTLACEEGARQATSSTTLLGSLRNSWVISLGAMYFGICAATFGLNLWLPQIIKSAGFSTVESGLISAIPYAFGTIVTVICGRTSDRLSERKWHVIVPAITAWFGLALSGYSHEPFVQLVGICLAASGIYAFYAVFWSVPAARLGGVAAAGGIALINSIGTVGSFSGSFIVGWTKQLTGEYQPGLFLLSSGPLVAAIIGMRVLDRRGGRRPPSQSLKPGRATIRPALSTEWR